MNDLQREASKKFGFDTTKTLNIAQLLYEKYADITVDEEGLGIEETLEGLLERL